MAHQITLSDEDYAALAAASTQTGEPIKRLIHKAIAAHYVPQQPAKQARQVGNYQYPTGEPISDEEEDELERLAQEIGSDHPWASEIVIEERGPH